MALQAYGMDAQFNGLRFDETGITSGMYFNIAGSSVDNFSAALLCIFVSSVNEG